MKLQLVPRSAARSTIRGKKVRPCSARSYSCGTKGRRRALTRLVPFSFLPPCLQTTRLHAEFLHSTCLQSRRSWQLSRQHTTRPVLSLTSGKEQPHLFSQGPKLFSFLQIETALGTAYGITFRGRQKYGGGQVLSVFCQPALLPSIQNSRSWPSHSLPTSKNPFYSTLP